MNCSTCRYSNVRTQDSKKEKFVGNAFLFSKHQSDDYFIFTKLHVSMKSLNVERLWLILDLLKTNDICFSFHLVCKCFYTIANNYNRLKSTFTYQALGFDIRRLCRIVQVENIISLTLQNSLQFKYCQVLSIICIPSSIASVDTHR